MKYQNEQPFYFVCSPLLEIQEIGEVGAGYSYHRGFSYMAGLKKLVIGGSRFSFCFFYFVGMNKINVSDNALIADKLPQIFFFSSCLLFEYAFVER